MGGALMGGMLPQVSTQRLEWRVQHEGGHASTSTRGTVRMAGALRVGRASTSVRWTVGLQGATSRGGACFHMCPLNGRNGGCTRGGGSFHKCLVNGRIRGCNIMGGACFNNCPVNGWNGGCIEGGHVSTSLGSAVGLAAASLINAWPTLLMSPAVSFAEGKTTIADRHKTR